MTDATAGPVVLIAIGLLFLPAPRLWSQGTGSAGAKRRELREVQKELEQKKREAEEYQRQADILNREVSDLATATTQSRRKLRTLDSKIRQTEAMKASLKARLGALQLAENQWQAVLTDELNAYFESRFSQWDYYGRRDLWLDGFRKAAIMGKEQYVEGLHGFREKTEVAQTEVARQKNRLQSTANQARAEHLSRETLYRQKKEVYLENKQKVAETLQQIQELKDSAVALTRLVRSLERRTAYRASGPSVPLAEAPHSLPWPVDGQVVTSFGKQMLPELHSWIVHQGIRVATEAGALVHPVKEGRVIYAGAFRSYGQVVIMDHGQEFYTIYGMLGKILKKNGETARPKDAVGVAGPSGQGGIVYFEIRQSGDALDPAAWLKQR